VADGGTFETHRRNRDVVPDHDSQATIGDVEDCFRRCVGAVVSVFAGAVSEDDGGNVIDIGPTTFGTNKIEDWGHARARFFDFAF
jgi:hypothetical protein